MLTGGPRATREWASSLTGTGGTGWMLITRVQMWRKHVPSLFIIRTNGRFFVFYFLNCLQWKGDYIFNICLLRAMTSTLSSACRVRMVQSSSLECRFPGNLRPRAHAPLFLACLMNGCITACHRYIPRQGVLRRLYAPLYSITTFKSNYVNLAQKRSIFYQMKIFFLHFSMNIFPF